MGEWYKTGCVLCPQNCGLQILVEDNHMVKVRPDKSNVRSEGYVCRKGLNVPFHQHHADRLTYPLKKVDGGFQIISWEQAIDEIAAKLREILDTYGPRSLAYMGGGGQGCHFEAAFGVGLMRALGSRWHYSAAAQEFGGIQWVAGRSLGRQYMFTGCDHHESDLLLAIGWNGWMSHQIPQTRRVLSQYSRDPDKLLVVIDPRKSETAERADIHLAVRPGTDALLTRAMIAIILQEGWQNQDYIDKYVNGFELIKPWFQDFDARAAIEVCELDYEQVQKVCRLIATRKTSMHPDLGIFMNRHSTLTSYLHMILMAICGRWFIPGGNILPGWLMPLGSHSDERDPKAWRTLATNFPAIMGTYPPNVMPEEIISGHPEHLRAVLIAGSNPLRSYADTTAYEQAFSQLDLLVTVELAMTETAALSHYVLPARSAYESWDGTFFPHTFPEVFFQMRRPIIKPEGEPVEAGEVWVRIADRMGLIPPIPDELYEAAARGRLEFGQELMKYLEANPKAAGMMPFILAKTLGRQSGSVNLASLWGILQTMPKSTRENAVRVGFKPGPLMGDEIFQAILDHPEGLWIGRVDPEKNMNELKTEDGKIHVYAPEMKDWLLSITPVNEKKALAIEPDYPLILLAGRHMDMNANTLMRNPEWNTGRRACTLAMNPQDGEEMGLADGQMVRVTTEAGSEEIELEITDAARKGQVIMPHGFGLVYNGKKYGANANRLAKNTNRDRFAATPLHRYIPCRVEAL